MYMLINVATVHSTLYQKPTAVKLTLSSSVNVKIKEYEIEENAEN